MHDVEETVDDKGTIAANCRGHRRSHFAVASCECCTVHWLQDSTLVAAEIFHQQAMIASSAARKFKFLNQKMTAVRLESLAVMGRSAVEDLVHDARCHQANDLQKAVGDIREVAV